MKIDPAKRRRVMQRSMKLGHCICDPRKPCPCDVFTEQGHCPCAGEKPDPVPAEQVRLTQLVRNAGCASKIPAGELDAILARLPKVDDPAVLSGVAAGEDAAIYDLGAAANGHCLIQTVDVMTPVVDDPFTFGRICAANCLSDIYAMGGTPRTALSVVAFPSETLDAQILYLMLKGAMATLAEANVALVGGHSIKDAEIKLGFAITGTIEAAAAVRQDRAAVGDLLVLTKPLGSGVLSFARQIGRGEPDQFAAMEAAMAGLNRGAAEAMREAGASACTDVTGFGLFAHLLRVLRHSEATAELAARALPALLGALDALRDGIVPGAIERNREYVGEDLEVASGVEEALVHLGYDAQTSGGLLIAVPPARHPALLEALRRREVGAATIGCLTEKSAGRIVLRPGAEIPVPGLPQGSSAMADTPSPAKRDAAACCASAPTGTGAAAATTATEAKRAFGTLARAAGAAGVVDARTKELVNFALVLLARCAPCVQAHLAKAKQIGITQPELDEVAWCAIAMGGAPVKMFYDEALKASPPAGGGACCGGH